MDFDSGSIFNEIDISNCCRTCLDTASVMHDVFSEKESVNIVEILYICTSIQANENEELLPRKMCDNCYVLLVNFYDFRNKAQIVNKKLQHITKPCGSVLDSPKETNRIYDIKTETDDILDNEDCKSVSQEMFVDVSDYNYENIPSVNPEVEFNTGNVLKEYKCEICSTAFVNKIKLGNHEQKYTDKKSCCLCKKRFRKMDKYEQHLHGHRKKNKIEISNEDDGNTYKCNDCNASFHKLQSLSAHMKRHRGSRNLSCKVCLRTFKKAYSLNRHKTIHMLSRSTLTAASLPNSDVKQELIANGTAKDQEGNKSTDLDESPQIYECKFCNAAFRKANSLSAHMKIHKDGTKKLTCSVCAKTFKKTYHLNRHELIHVKNFKCTFCPKTFVDRSEWRIHVKKHDEYAPIPCPICSKLLYHQESLTRHMKVHTKQMGSLCPHCGKTFENVSNLRQHIKRHLGQKDFSCILCPEKFITRGELKHHMVVHTEERAFSCNQCGLKFTRMGSLKMHKLKHLDHRPFKCDSCPMGFPTKYMLQRHTRIHTGEKPFKCNLCDRTFGQSGELLKHRRTHLGEKIHRCSECHESFRYKVDLRKHITEHYMTEKSKDNIDNIAANAVLCTE